MSQDIQRLMLKKQKFGVWAHAGRCRCLVPSPCASVVFSVLELTLCCCCGGAADIELWQTEKQILLVRLPWFHGVLLVTMGKPGQLPRAGKLALADGPLHRVLAYK